MNIDGIIGKIEDKADWAAGIAAVYLRSLEGDFPITDLPASIMTQLGFLFKDPVNIIKYKLWDSTHAYTGLFKIGALLWGAHQVGLVDARYGKIGEKIAKGAGIVALVLPGSGPVPDAPNSSGNFGSGDSKNPFEGRYA